MDILRQRLIDKIDDILLQTVHSQQVPAYSQVHIEANFVLAQNAPHESTRILLDSIDVDKLRSLSRTSSDAGASTSNGTPHPIHQSSLPVASVVPEVARYVTNVDPKIQTPIDIPPLPFSAAGLAKPVPNFSASGQSQGDARARKESMSHEPPTPYGAEHAVAENHEYHPPKRRKQEAAPSPLDQPAVDKLIEGIFEQIHNPKTLSVDDGLIETMHTILEKMPTPATPLGISNREFEDVTKCCRYVTTAGTIPRVLEVMVQAYWVDCYDTRLSTLKDESPDLRAHEYKRTLLTEACTSLAWSEKELRNRMAIWKGYREIKNAAGWGALIFAGPGIYRFCKYRLGFDRDSVTKLENLRTRAEVAADTLQSPWRQLLSLVSAPSKICWQGHPHDWTVSMVSSQGPLPLAITYRQWDLNFSFENVPESVVDVEQWQDHDPRRFEDGPEFFCKSCNLKQSHLTEDNECECFPDLYSPNPRVPCPVQIFRTQNGKNNGLIACCSFDRGRAVGEFVGTITKGLADVDVMQSQAGENEPYQIWQGTRGNFTRFMNHSCAPNCQFQTFSWMGVQRIVVVSKGIPAGKELTVDYSSHYWENLDKICLCGEACCRYKDRARKAVPPDNEAELTNGAASVPPLTVT